jgi:uncharacterized membrane protein YphA (DoxX/SURF4 family)
MSDTMTPYWPPFSRFVFRWGLITMGLLLISFPFTYNWLSYPPQWLLNGCTTCTRWTAIHLLGLPATTPIHLFSDTLGLYVHLFNIVLVATMVAIVWSSISRQKAYPQLYYTLQVMMRYYLALQLLVYGIGKVFNTQFYLPEPNTIYTPLADIPRDLLYWTTMSLSRPYTIAMGIAELLAALLLWFRRTTLAGAVLSVGILINVVLINLGYDISVKLHSGLLVLLACLLLLPYRRRLWQLFTRQAMDITSLWSPSWRQRSQWRYWILKTAVIGLCLTEGLLPYIRSGEYNDDTIARPPLHGAYEVVDFIRNGDTIPPLTTDRYRWKRFFVHRQYYGIIQGMQDGMTDFELAYDTVHRALVLTRKADSTRLVLQYQPISDSSIQFRTMLQQDSIVMNCIRLNWQKTRLLEKRFEWIAE